MNKYAAAMHTLNGINSALLQVIFLVKKLMITEFKGFNQS